MKNKLLELNFYIQEILSEISQPLINRVKLIRAMQSVAKQFPGKYDEIIKNIKDPKLSGFLTTFGDDIGKISFSRNKEDFRNEKFRQQSTLGKFIKRNLKNIDLKDQEIDEFVNKTFAELSNEIPGLKEFEGEDIEKRYSKYSTTNDLKSCMAKETHTFLTKIYSINPQKVKLLEFFNGQNRALLWTTDDGTKVLDRVYPSQHKNNEAIICWAKKKGYKTRTNYDSLNTDHNRINELDKQYFITLSTQDIEALPYIDTFCYFKYNEENNTVLLSNMSFNNSSIALHADGILLSNVLTPKEAYVRLLNGEKFDVYDFPYMLLNPKDLNLDKKYVTPKLLKIKNFLLKLDEDIEISIFDTINFKQLNSLDLQNLYFAPKRNDIKSLKYLIEEYAASIYDPFDPSIPSIKDN